MTLDPDKNRAIKELISRRQRIVEQIAELDRELREIDSRLFQDAWSHIFEDKLLDMSVLRAVGMVHFYDDALSRYFVVRDLRRHQYYVHQGQRLEVDAVAVYELSSGVTRTVGFELKLDNKADALDRAIEQAVVRRPLFDYFYIVYGGWYIYYAVEMAGDFLSRLSRHGIGLILRPADLHAEILSRPIVFYRSRYAGGADGF